MRPSKTLPHTPPPPVARSDKDLTRYLGAVRVMPSFSLTRIAKGIERMGDEAQRAAHEELSDLAKRCEAEAAGPIGPGLADHGERFEKRLTYICEQESQFRRLDALSGLNPNVIDSVALIKGAHACAEHFMQPRCISLRQQRDVRFDNPGFLLERLEELGLEAPASLPPEQLQPRLTDWVWWKNTLRQNLRVRRENAARALDARKIRWCSPDGLAERRDHDLRQSEWASSMVFSDGHGGTFPCPTPSEAARKQYAELLAKNAATVAMAREEGLNDCIIITITCPSRFHPCTTIGEGKNKKRIRNHRWDLSTPADAIQWLRLNWARVRSCLKRRKIGKFFLQCTHVHEDETPHLHIIFFEEKENFVEIVRLAKKYFNEGGKHQVDEIEECDQGRGVAYAARAVAYVSRSVEGGADGMESEVEAASTKQAAATFRFRRFSTSQGGVTAYRLARRKDVLPEGDELGDAARAGDFLAFYKAYTAREGKIHRGPARNRYDEPILSVKGLEIDGEIHVKTISWKIERKGATAAKRTVTAIYQGAEGPDPQTQKTERQEAREWLENYISEQEKKPKPVRASTISNEEWAKAYKEWKKRNRR